MFGWLVLLAAIVAMYRIAEIEGKSGLPWGTITLVFCLTVAYVLPGWPLVNVALGGVLSFITMFIYKVARE